MSLGAPRFSQTVNHVPLSIMTQCSFGTGSVYWPCLVSKTRGFKMFHKLYSFSFKNKSQSWNQCSKKYFKSPLQYVPLYDKMWLKFTVFLKIKLKSYWTVKKFARSTLSLATKYHRLRGQVTVTCEKCRPTQGDPGLHYNTLIEQKFN